MRRKVKLQKIVAKGFRGTRKEVWLDFGKNNRSVVLFGNNGDGKSSFSDALEWFFTDKIAYLQREGCGRVDYFNRYMSSDDDAVVQIGFNDSRLDSGKILKRKGGATFTNTTSDLRNYIRDSSRDSFILRHHTMREFIDKTKKDKLERIEEIIGFDIVKESRESLLKAFNSLKDDRELNNLRGQLSERERDLVKAIGKGAFGETDILKHADGIAKECDVSLAIANDSDFEIVCGKLEKKVKESDRAKELSRLDYFDKDISRLGKIRDFCIKASNLLKAHNDLAKRSETIKASAMDKLYKAAIETIEKGLAEPGICPVCKQPIDTEFLLNDLKDEIREIEKVLKERKEVIENAKVESTKVADYQATLRNLLEDEGNKIFLSTEIVTELNKAAAVLSTYKEVFDKIEKSLELVSEPQFSNLLESFEGDLEKIRQSISQRRKELKETDEEKEFYGNVHKLKKLCDDYSRHKEIRKLISIYNKQIDSLEKICRDFESMERENVGKVLKAISSDVNDFIRFLHPDDNFDEVELIPTAERGIEFRLKYHGVEISPPMKILSEAHLNSFGICVFLASAKHFNKTNGFLVLDDVVTSFDTGHRRPLARLLTEKFPEFQFLLFTHDDLWFEMLKRELSTGKWIFKELEKWTKENGLNLKDSPLTLKERIRNSLITNDISGAANKSRTLIEEILKVKCEQLGVKSLEFRTGIKNDRREASELIDALISYLKNNETLRDEESKKSFNHLRASQLIANIGSHHEALKATTLSRGDVETTLRDIDEFESLFVCPKCKKEASIKYSPRNNKLKQCECGQLRI